MTSEQLSDEALRKIVEAGADKMLYRASPAMIRDYAAWMVLLAREVLEQREAGKPPGVPARTGTGKTADGTG